MHELGHAIQFYHPELQKLAGKKNKAFDTSILNPKEGYSLKELKDIILKDPEYNTEYIDSLESSEISIALQ